MLTLRTLYFEDLSVGMTEQLTKIVASSDVVGFAEVTGDRNPIHLSEHFAAKTPFGTRIAHGLYTASLISAVLGTRLPGPGAIYISQTLNFRAPVKIGDTVAVNVSVAELMREKFRARRSYTWITPRFSRPEPSHPFEQRAITAANAKAMWRSPQSDVELMTEKQILSSKPAPRLELAGYKHSERVQNCKLALNDAMILLTMRIWGRMEFSEGTGKTFQFLAMPRCPFRKSGVTAQKSDTNVTALVLAGAV